MNMQSKQVKYFGRKVTVSDKLKISSYNVAELIVQKTKSHSIATIGQLESLILTSCREIVKIIFHDEASYEMSKIPLSNGTIRRRINDISVNMKESVNKILLNTNISSKY